MKESTQTKLSKLLWGVVLAPILILICSLGLVSACADIPSFEELEHPENKLATQVIADGGELLTTDHLQHRSDGCKRLKGRLPGKNDPCC